MHHVADVAGVDIDTAMHNEILNKNIRIGAWTQVFGGLLALGLLFYLYRRYRHGRKGF